MKLVLLRWLESLIFWRTYACHCDCGAHRAFIFFGRRRTGHWLVKHAKRHDGEYDSLIDRTA